MLCCLVCLSAKLSGCVTACNALATAHDVLGVVRHPAACQKDPVLLQQVAQGVRCCLQCCGGIIQHHTDAVLVFQTWLYERKLVTWHQHTCINTLQRLLQQRLHWSGMPACSSSSMFAGCISLCPNIRSFVSLWNSDNHSSSPT